MFSFPIDGERKNKNILINNVSPRILGKNITHHPHRLSNIRCDENHKSLSRTKQLIVILFFKRMGLKAGIQ